MPQANVLGVYGNPIDSRLCQLLLEQASFQVTTAANSGEVLAHLEDQAFDLLLVDVHIPNLDGFKLIDKALHLQPKIAVLVITGFGSVNTALQALQRGVAGLILKPFESGKQPVEAARKALLESRQNRDAARLQV